MNPDPTINVVSYLRDVAGRVPERRALVMPDDSTVTFAELWQRVCRVAAGLRGAGLQPGDRLVVMIPMSIDLYTVLLAIIQVGAVAVFVDPWMSMRKIAQFAAFAEPAGFAGVGRSHLLRLWEPALRLLPLTITTGRRLGPLPAAYRLAELLRTEPDPRVWIPESPEAPALITFTSGSSGTPKGANRTHGFLAAQYAALCAEYTYDPADVDMPMFPVFALRNLADGIPSVIPDVDFRRIHETKGDRVLRQIARHGVRTCTASPPFVDQLAAASQSAGRDPGLRRILTGGAPVSNAMLQRWHAAFPNTAITVVYGSTEAEPVASITLHERLACEGEGFCAGRPVDAVRARIIRIEKGPIDFESWETLAPRDGRIGELVVSGNHVCRDYFRNPDGVKENKILDADGVCWHRMGDTGYMDADGRFWLTGRVHTTIVRQGQLFHAQLIEAQIAPLMPGAVRVAALGRDDRLIVVVQGQPAPGAAERVRAAGIPVDQVRFTRKALPLDPRHRSKIDYGELERMLNEGSI
jgi:olefin beta-lactone synthetase